MTDSHSVSDMQIGEELEFKYVPKNDVPKWVAEGWTDKGAMPGPHGFYSHLCVRRPPPKESAE